MKRRLTNCDKLRILHTLRNPHGWSSEAIRQAQLDACEMIEALDGQYKPRRDLYCMSSDCLQQNRCLHAFDARCPTCGLLAHIMPCDSSGTLTGCFDQFHAEEMRKQNVPVGTAAVEIKAGQVVYRSATGQCWPVVPPPHKKPE